MRTLLVSLFVLTGLAACDSSDISDNPPISTTPPSIDASGADATADSGMNVPDSGGVTPDAAPLPTASEFCARYNQLCTFDGNPNWFTDESECLGVYGTLDTTRKDCVIGKLDEREAGGNNSTCADATGTGTCQ